MKKRRMNLPMPDKHCDTLIIGAGAAGLMAGIQAARRGRRVLILEKMASGGWDTVIMLEKESGKTSGRR